jgi:hypothetical protein
VASHVGRVQPLQRHHAPALQPGDRLADVREAVAEPLLEELPSPALTRRRREVRQIA